MRSNLVSIKVLGTGAALALGVWGCGSSGNEPELNAPLTSVSAGSLHSCGLTADGRGFCWGWNRDGQLGDGSTSDASAPQTVEGNLTFASIASGGGHTCGLTTDGTAFCWGFNETGQLGNGSQSAVRVPSPVDGGIEFASVGAGGSYSCALTADGTAYCWGWNLDGQLGIGSRTDSPTPVQVSGGITFESLQVGAFHTCGVTSTGEAYCWGRNTDGQLGDGSSTARDEPTLVDAPGVVFISISPGFQHTCGLSEGGEVFCWGSDTFGQLGNGSGGNSNTPVAINGASDFIALGSGASYACGVRASGAGECWGFNQSGQLGSDVADDCVIVDGDNQLPVACSPSPFPVAGGLTFTAISPNTQHTCGVAGGIAYCWGFGDRGQLGNGESGENFLSVEPVRVLGQG